MSDHIPTHLTDPDLGGGGYRDRRRDARVYLGPPVRSRSAAPSDAYRKAAAEHTRAVAEAARLGREKNLALHRHAQAVAYGVPADRVAKLAAALERATDAYRAACAEADRLNAVAAGLRPVREVWPK